MAAAARLTIRLIARTASIVLAAAAIAGAALLWLGPPSLARQYRVPNELVRFAPTVGHGALQLFGETLFLLVVTWIGRRWLRIRL